ncbi:nucleotidyltransferase family protein [Lepagella muris]|jgi:hypothetical protein|uniref:Nucleotidyltransferase n=1 Tax=Lepagella muris TaxID=3032870 RepID=A0AC61RCQ2_9BACT|nr:nucleotidyltransferase domain-containing protein [Lepagella muris]ROT07334.1 nucleotidyltransferase [Muribaculaceae bacterium Isolate-037 (Harlan)]TGY75987.1 nucleotidyltransferase [Lepagella muris]THG46568.1 nucleotidyltransferase [Bacteroidales bacterium]TKC55035.1 nucleotidyltransferase [Bacteroidales bacterium]
MYLIDRNISKILELCRRYKVKTLYVFGSILTSRFNRNSDVDLLVRFRKEEIPLLEYADNFFDFQTALESLFNRKVDLVCEDAIKNSYFRQEVDSKKQLIYS